MAENLLDRRRLLFGVRQGCLGLVDPVAIEEGIEIAVPEALIDELAQTVFRDTERCREGADGQSFAPVGAFDRHQILEPPDPSERVNVYLPKSLIGRVDQRAAELGMSRSSFFGLAVSIAMDRRFTPSLFGFDLATPRSKVQKRGPVATRQKPRGKPPR